MLDLLDLDADLPDEDRLLRDTVRKFADDRLRPHIRDWYEDGTLPARELAGEFGALGVLGMHLSGYGCPGASATQYGIVCAEIEAVDSGLRSLVSVQGSLAMYAIHAYGDEEQKQRWLPGMAAAELIGCFGLTEPDSGSDPGSMTTRARRDGGGYVLSGTKMWITSEPIADLAVVWAKVDDGDASSIRGFVVERGMKGFETPTIHGKMSLRASPTGEIVLNEVRVPEANVLPGVVGLKGPLGCLTQARFGISWGALGAARACYDAAVSYARERVQFGQPIASKQLVQEQLVEMAMEIAKGQIMALHFARLKD